MANGKKKIRLSKESVVLISVIVFLLITASFLHNRIAGLTEDNLKNLAMLNQVVPDFNINTSEQLKQDIDRLEGRLLAYAYLFDPPQKEIKKDYDIPIFFVEELSRVKRSLKTKAEDKNISYPELGFKEALPDEKEARYLLKQLYVIRDVISTGIDDGVNFISAAPQPAQELDVSPGIKSSRVRMEFFSMPTALVNFLIRLSDIVPIYSVERILIKSQDSTFKADMLLSHALIEADWKDKTMTSAPINLKEIFSGDDKIISSLRANNPFSVVRAREAAPLPAKTPAEKQSPRFLYKGKGVLKSKEVAVIEDTLRQETLFLGIGERIDDFTLNELNESQIILKNTKTGQETVIKRQEE